MAFIQTSHPDRKIVGYWLFFMAFLVFAMVMVGGATRLTESGLSMVNWRPVTGVLPPLGEEAWMSEFRDYQASPEYQQVNEGMSLEEFKGIYWWEWGHRLLGRFIGLAFFLPLVFFWRAGRIPDGYKPRLVTLFVLGGLQGVLGWYMVKSGLVDVPHVSHYRLAAHLMLALFVFAALLWTALDLVRPVGSGGPKPLKRLTHVTMLLLVIQLVLGAFVAGLKAGLIYNTWPLMGDSFMAGEVYVGDSFWRTLVDDHATVQFHHRVTAYLIAVMSFVIWLNSRKLTLPVIRNYATLLLCVTLVQITLGIVTLLKVVPVGWGTTHQGGGVLLLAVLVAFMHEQRAESAR